MSWNSGDKSASITLSTVTESNDTAAATAAGYTGVRGTTSHTTGLYYLEYVIVTVDGTLQFTAGFGNATESLANFVGSSTNSCSFQPGPNGSGGSTYYNGSGLTGFDAGQGHIVAAVVDTTTHLAAFYDDIVASWIGNGGGTTNPVTETNMVTAPTGAVFPMFAGKTVSAVQNTVRLRTLAADFTYPAGGGAPPTGYTAWDVAATTAALGSAVGIGAAIGTRAVTIGAVGLSPSAAQRTRWWKD